MSAYMATLLLMVSATFLFSAKTEQTRVITIQKPLVITQERRTPAFYAYQQAQAILKNPTRAPAQATTFLSQQSFNPHRGRIQLAEFKFSKREYAQMFNRLDQTTTQVYASAEQNPTFDFERVVFDTPKKEPTVLDSFEQEPALSPEKKWATLKGKFELKDGVGIVDHITNLRRVEEGQTREIGRIDLKAGTYSIDIESPNGYLIAQIKDRSGFVIGEDRQRIANLQNKGIYFEGPFIRVGRPPVLTTNLETDGSAGLLNSGGRTTSTSVAKTNSSKTVSEAGTSANSNFVASVYNSQKTLSAVDQEISNVSLFSSSIARIDDPSGIYLNLTTVRMTGDKSETPVLTQKWLQGTLAYIADTQKLTFRASNSPVMIGRAMINGKPAAGLEATIPSLPSYQAIYLDEFMIPSQHLRETSTNGYFMFVDLDSDSYEVAISKFGQVMASQLFVAEESRVAFQNIQALQVPSSRTLRAFDAFTSEVVASDLLSASYSDVIQMPEGATLARNNVGQNVSHYFVRTKNPQYVDSVYVTAGERDYVHIPLIQTTWLEQVRLARGILAEANTATIIGFTMNLSYNAYLAADKYNANQIAYFNSFGQLTESPVAGGGFILFNVPAGPAEAVLQENGTERLYSQVFGVKPGQVLVTHFSE